jgi:hypothetical protein
MSLGRYEASVSVPHMCACGELALGHADSEQRSFSHGSMVQRLARP